MKPTASDLEWYMSVMSTLNANMQGSAKMYPAGAIAWVIGKPQGGGSGGAGGAEEESSLRMVMVDNETFGHIRLSRSMVSDHLPRPYEKALEELLLLASRSGS